MARNPITRRETILGLGVTSIAGFGGISLLTEPALATDHTAESGDGLVLDWVATRNGQLDEGSVDASGSTFTYSVGNLVPGAFGTLTVEMSLTDGTDDAEPRFAFEVTENAENAINDPEGDAGDTSPGEGELADAIEVEIFYDTGMLGVDSWGATNGEQDLGEGLIDDDARGTLAEVAAALPDDGENGVLLDADPASSGDDPLTDSNSVAITFGWAFPDVVDNNRTQTDSVGFDLIFAAEGVEG